MLFCVLLGKCFKPLVAMHNIMKGVTVSMVGRSNQLVDVLLSSETHTAVDIPSQIDHLI